MAVVLIPKAYQSRPVVGVDVSGLGDVLPEGGMSACQLASPCGKAVLTPSSIASFSSSHGK